MANTFLAFCGQPGVASDLNVLEAALHNLGASVKIHGCRDLVDAEILLAKLSGQGSHIYVIGYSRGCGNTLRLAQDIRVNACLLIAPHWGGAAPSWIMQQVLRVPLLSSLLLYAFGPRRIKRLLHDTCAPQVVPPLYAKLAPQWSRPSVLRHAMLSPVLHSAEIQYLAERYAISERPIKILAGDSDKSLPFAQQLYTWMPSSELCVVPQAGHALPWTHTNICAQSSLFDIHTSIRMFP